MVVDASRPLIPKYMRMICVYCDKRWPETSPLGLCTQKQHRMIRCDESDVGPYEDWFMDTVREAHERSL